MKENDVADNLAKTASKNTLLISLQEVKEINGQITLDKWGTRWETAHFHDRKPPVAPSIIQLSEGGRRNNMPYVSVRSVMEGIVHSLLRTIYLAIELICVNSSVLLVIVLLSCSRNMLTMIFVLTHPSWKN